MPEVDTNDPEDSDATAVEIAETERLKGTVGAGDIVYEAEPVAPVFREVNPLDKKIEIGTILFFSKKEDWEDSVFHFNEIK